MRNNKMVVMMMMMMMMTMMMMMMMMMMTMIMMIIIIYNNISENKYHLCAHSINVTETFKFVLKFISDFVLIIIIVRAHLV